MSLRIAEGRTVAERRRDDERSELELCGMTEDEREQTEVYELDARHYDFIFLPAGGLPPVRRRGPAAGSTP